MVSTSDKDDRFPCLILILYHFAPHFKVQTQFYKGLISIRKLFKIKTNLLH